MFLLLFVCYLDLILKFKHEEFYEKKHLLYQNQTKVFNIFYDIN